MGLMSLIEAIRVRVRAMMRLLARGLNTATGGKLHPDVVTIVGFLAHIPIAVLIATGNHNILAGVLLLVFGLFDTLDGEIARLQNRASPRGMLLDASTDRMKEVLLYIGTAYVLAGGAHPKQAVWAVAACGASLCVSYVKAKGEAAVAAGKPIPHAVLNKLFKDGLLTFELRMFVLLVGLFADQLVVAVAAIAVLACWTAFQRLIRISKALGNG
jgi:phosphatidylglycerophosphate synthase